MSRNETEVEKNLQERSILVSREFKAPLQNVWRAHTESKLLDQWWGPAPWRAETKTLNFSVGGHWLYAMIGPQNEKHWARMNYTAIDLHKRFDVEDHFCDENGQVNSQLPTAKGYMAFAETPGGTRVNFKAYYATEEDVQKMIEMGFEEGISICMDQLAALISAKKI